MNTYNTLKNELLQVNKDILSLLSEAKSVRGTDDQSFNNWQKTCRDIRTQISEEVIRVAVVGPIKSGKSTFVNSLFKGDYLKRGAGVVTSIVTRVRNGTSLKAELHFKSWDEVNAEMKNALVLFPSAEWQAGNKSFDIREENDRAAIEGALGMLTPDLLITNDTRDMNSVLLTSYLTGYERVKDILSAEDTAIRQHEGDDFLSHKDFVGDDSLAVYLNDLRLEISSGDIDSDIEIADCQGSDSPNPLHLAMIEDYLLQTHLIVYVISSRTGLRQADIRFLSVIKKMGISDNIVFILNTDFNEHESAEDLNALIERVKGEISLIKPSPEIYTLSALFNLFESQKENLSQRDRQRLLQWEKESAFSEFSYQETTRFASYLNHKFTTERYALLLKNHMERLAIISSGVAHRIGVNTNILSGDTHNADKMIKKISLHRKKMKQIRSMTESALNGAVKKLKQELRTDIDRFFDIRSGYVLGRVLRFIKDYDASYHKYEDNLSASGFPNIMYLVFQEFRQAADTFMAEDINPDIIRFIKAEEKKIREYLEAVTGPYDSMVQDALSEYNSVMEENFGISSIQGERHIIELPNTNLVKRTTNLNLPHMISGIRYSALIKTEAVMRFGFYAIIRGIKKLLKKAIQNEKEGGLLALKHGVARLKQETEKATVFYFKDYRENIKFQYAFKLTDALSDILRDILLDRFQAYVSDLSELADLINRKQADKEKLAGILEEMGAGAGEIIQKINVLKEKTGAITEQVSRKAVHTEH
ncbi:dynamin family protein [Desulfococcaceae bacterium HSG8]|nr:dynamin family protein [Desulfococcaceae bacterium HSG8]